MFATIMCCQGCQRCEGRRAYCLGPVLMGRKRLALPGGVAPSAAATLRALGDASSTPGCAHRSCSMEHSMLPYCTAGRHRQVMELISVSTLHICKTWHVHARRLSPVVPKLGWGDGVMGKGLL